MPSPYVVDHDALPAYAQQTPLIRSGYRRPGYMHVKDDSERPYIHDSWYKCWKSVWLYWHNETINIHTHMWGAVFAIALLALQLAYLHHWLPGGPWSLLSLDTLPPPTILEPYPHLGLAIHGREQKDRESRQVTATGLHTLGAAMTCLGCSATYHTVVCRSNPVAQKFNRLDYVGIVVLIVGSNVPALHFGFHCHPHLRTIYVTLALAWGVLAMYVVTQPQYTVPKYKPLRAGIFIALGLSAVLPVVHGLWIAGDWHFVSQVLGARHIMYSGAVYIAGALIYVAHIPERWSPYTFDIIGASHQIFHVCVLIGAWLHWLGVRQAYTFWHALETTAAGAFGQEAVCAAVHAAIATGQGAQ